MLKYLKTAISVALILFIFQVDAISQIGSKINIGAGIVTTNIISNNRATLPIGPTAIEGEAYIGGSFKNSQPGIQLKGTYLMDNNPDLRFTTTIDYMFFSGRERYGYPPNVVIFYKHDVDIASFSTGFEYVWANLDFANAKLYAGLDIQMNWIQVDLIRDSYFSEHVKFLDKYEPDWIFEYSKGEAFRFGGNVRVGVEGKLRNNVHVNAGFAVGVMNLLGRDDSRGELLTPMKVFESKENILPVFQVFILVQYNI
jgi:hypothetical protein